MGEGKESKTTARILAQTTGNIRDQKGCGRGLQQVRSLVLIGLETTL